VGDTARPPRRNKFSFYDEKAIKHGARRSAQETLFRDTRISDITEKYELSLSMMSKHVYARVYAES